MENSVVTQANRDMANGLRNMIVDYMEEHPHETKLIGWIGVLALSIFGICSEGAAIKSGR